MTTLKAINHIYNEITKIESEFEHEFFKDIYQIELEIHDNNEDLYVEVTHIIDYSNTNEFNTSYESETNILELRNIKNASKREFEDYINEISCHFRYVKSVFYRDAVEFYKSEVINGRRYF